MQLIDYLTVKLATTKLSGWALELICLNEFMSILMIWAGFITYLKGEIASHMSIR